MLEKYHKQKVSKKVIKEYEGLSAKYELSYKANDEFDLIKLSIFDTSLKQKKFFETAFESVRNECFDMWDYLKFYEKNDLILLEVGPKTPELKQFTFDETTIFIPFFDRLLNSLYATEIAILEKPQFFELYENFNKRIIPLETYGLDIYRSGFARIPMIASNRETVILFDPAIKVFYKITDDSNQRYPINIKADISSDQVKKLAVALIKNETEFIDLLIADALIKPRCIKKIQKARRKNEAK